MYVGKRYTTQKSVGKGNTTKEENVSIHLSLCLLTMSEGRGISPSKTVFWLQDGSVLVFFSEQSKNDYPCFVWFEQLAVGSEIWEVSTQICISFHGEGNRNKSDEFWRSCHFFWVSCGSDPKPGPQFVKKVFLSPMWQRPLNHRGSVSVSVCRYNAALSQRCRVTLRKGQSQSRDVFKAIIHKLQELLP